MTPKSDTYNRLGHLLLSAATGALLAGAAQFGGWFVAFIIMRLIGKSLMVGMYYLAWPIVFPLLSMPTIFLLMLIVIPLFRQPYPEILAQRSFLFGILIPTVIISMALMFATCPLENGGTLLTTGRDAFG